MTPLSEKQIEEVEKILEKKLKEELAGTKNEVEILRRECEGLRKGFVEIISHVTKLITQTPQTPAQQAVYLDAGSECVDDEIKKLKRENKFLQEKLEAQEDIIAKLNEELDKQ